MLNDDSVDDSPDVDVGPPDLQLRHLGPREQGHGRSSVSAANRHVIDDKVSFSEHMVVIDRDLIAEIVVDHRDDAFPTLSALRTTRVVLAAGSMVDHVF